MTKDDESSPFPVPPGVDVNVPSAARIYDYLLGGAHSLAVDRQFGDKVLAIAPGVAWAARANREFVMRAAAALAREGFDQWIDCGCGLPAVGAVHEVVRHIVPDARVAYADNEAVAYAYGTMLVENLPHTIMLNGDVRHPDTWLDAPETQMLLDFDRPIVVVLAAVLHFIPDEDDPTTIMADIRGRLPHGSRLIVSHGCMDDNESATREVQALYRTSNNPGLSRNLEQFTAILTDAGYEITDPPGVTWVTDIYPEPDDPRSPDDGPRSVCYGAVCTVP
ncbi:MAG TPA: SAM-dependent methyltransferase [Pseudonocardiaceae bacterium]|nr:SAM-dependent methyltransferase [Pseudonocardiaceae bacterium]